jgi:hypothetical protein
MSYEENYNWEDLTTNETEEQSKTSDTTTTIGTRRLPKAGSTKKYVEPCVCAPTAELDDPMHPRDWEMPDNRQLLWEQEVHRTNGGDSRSIAWLTLYYGCDGDCDDHDDDYPCRFVVVLNDMLVSRESHGAAGCWQHDITSTFLGQYLLQAWIAIHPEKHAALPNNYKEWRERERQSIFKEMAAEVKESGIDIEGMLEEDVYQCWKALIRKRRPAELERQGYSPEQIAQKMSEEFDECPM